MPRQLALLLCTIFVLYLLRLDRRQSKGVARALWLPSLWMIYVSSKPLGIWFQSQADASGGSPLDRMFLTGLLFCGLYILAKRKAVWSTFAKQNRALVLLLGYMLVSVLWSEIPDLSFKRWVRELTAITMGLLVLSDPAPRQAMQTILRRSVYVLIPYSMLLIKYFPLFGTQYGRWSGEIMWVGVTLQKNGLGRLCLMAIFFLIWTLTRRLQGRDIAIVKHQAKIELFLLGLSLWLLKGPGLKAYSATGVVSLIAGVAVYAGLLWMRRKKLGAKFAVFALVAAAFAYGVFMPVVLGGAVGQGITAKLGRDATLTGRTEIWRGLLPCVAEKPLLGAGFGSFWTAQNRIIHDNPEAHNGYLDVMLELGVVGLLLVAAYLLTSCHRMLKALPVDLDWTALAVCIMLMAVVHNWTESSLNTFDSQLTATVMFLIVSFPAAVKRAAVTARV